MEIVTFAPASESTIAGERTEDRPAPDLPATPPGQGAPPPSSAAGRRPRIPWRQGDDPRWARPALALLLLATAAAYLTNLTASGYANSFYSAAAQAGSQSWSAFFFGSFDAANAITVDKPPAALWAMGLSVRIFGLNSFALLFPQVLMGVATVAVVHATVKRSFGAAAALLAGTILALTPVAVLMFRFNNPDALLTLLMALGAWATLRAVESGSVRWMTLAGVFIGFGFLTKTLQVLLVVPFFGIAYVFLADTTLRRRIVGALAGVGAMLVSGGWWVAVVELLPADKRPYVGGSQTNSFLELTFGYNGFGRLSGNETGSVGQRGPGVGTESVWRMFADSAGGQISWLLPTALLLLVTGLAMCGRAPRTDPRRAAYVVLGGWLLVTMSVFSLMAGIFHEYYTVALAPAIAAVVGMGARAAWERRATPAGSLTLAFAVGIAASWGFVLLSRTSAYGAWLRYAVLLLGLGAGLALLVNSVLPRRAVAIAAAAGMTAGLAGPAAFSASTIATGHTGSIVYAGPAGQGFRPGGLGGRGRPPGGFPGGAPGGQAGTFPGAPGGQGGTAPGAAGGFPGAAPNGQGAGAARGAMGGLLDASMPSSAVVDALKTNAATYTWVAAAVGSQNAAGLQLGTQLPVMAIGGFNGSDPSPTLAQFKDLVAQGKIHYFLSGGGFRGQNGGATDSSSIASWVASSFTSVTIDGQTFYDLTKPLTGGSVSAVAS